MRLDAAAPAACPARSARLALNVQRDAAEDDLALRLLASVQIAASEPTEGDAGLPEAVRSLPAEDVEPSGAERVRRATARVLRYQGRERLLVKVTGWSRIAYFDQIYPDALFVSLQRDPRSVVSSWIKAGWLDVTSAPTDDGWQWGPVPPGHYAVWEELGGDPVLSTALKIRLDLDDIAANAALFPDRVHELSYEQLITEPEPQLRRLCEFAGLDWTPGFEAVVEETELYDSTDTWRRHLSADDGDRVLEFLRRTGPGAA
jgi:hypothetical protein